MNHKNQNAVIREKILELLDGASGVPNVPANNITDKQEIYSKVVHGTGFPRPTVRRVARDLRNELLTKIKVLQSETQSTISSTTINPSEIPDYTSEAKKKARRKKILDNHPDRGGSDEALKKVLNE